MVCDRLYAPVAGRKLKELVPVAVEAPPVEAPLYAGKPLRSRKVAAALEG